MHSMWYGLPLGNSEGYLSYYQVNYDNKFLYFLIKRIDRYFLLRYTAE